MNHAMEDLENSVIRQAESMGYGPGSDELESLVRRKIIEPENDMMRMVRGSKFKIRADQFIDYIDMKYARYLFIKDLAKWCVRNKGMGIYRASLILQIDWEGLISAGKEADAMGFGDCVSLLDGTDDWRYDVCHPDIMSEGCRGSVGHWNN